MKHTLRATIRNGLLFIGIVALFLAINPAYALAQDITQDTDLDGFPNDAEEEGIPLHDDTAIVTNPLTPDVFVILDEDPACPLPSNPLKYFEQGGLGYEVHELTEDRIRDDRSVSRDFNFKQKAVRVRISCDPNGGIAGQANYGTPNDLDEAVVYVTRIENYVHSVYEDNGITKPANITSAIIDKYIRHTIAHEIGHTLRCAPEYNLSYGYHLAPKTRVMMDQFVWCKPKRAKDKVVWKIGINYAQPSIDGAALTDAAP